MLQARTPDANQRPEDSAARRAAIATAARWFDDGNLFRVLSERVACRSESQMAESAAELPRYLNEHIVPPWSVWVLPAQSCRTLLHGAVRC